MDLPARPPRLHAVCCLVLGSILMLSTGIIPPLAPARADTAALAGGRVAGTVPLALVRLGQVGGATFALDSDGRYVYFGVGPRLVIADNADPTAPLKVGETEPLGDLVRDVVVAGDRALLALGAAGVAVVDVAVPSRPRVVATYDTPGHAWAVASLDHVYVADGTGDLRILELVDDELREVAALELPDDALRIAGAGGYVYVVSDGPGNYRNLNISGTVQVVDVRRPREPRLVACDDPSLSGVAALAAAGDWLYIGGAWEPMELRVLSLTDPGAPQLVGTLPDVGWYGPLNDLSVLEGYAALAMGSAHPAEGSVTLVDVTNPAEPTQVGWVPVSEPGVPAVGLDVGRFVAALSDGGFVTYDLGTPEHPTRRGSIDAGFAPVSSAVADSMVYAAAGRTGLAVIDVDDPSAPALTGLYHGRAGGAVTYYADIALAEAASPGSPPPRAYLTTQHGDVVSTALRVFDLADPGGAREIAVTYEPWTWFGRLAVTDRHAFVVGEWWDESRNGFRVFDTASAITPTLVTTVTMRAPVDVVLHDGYAYVADAGYGLRAVDVREPATPRQTGEHSMIGRPTAVSVTDRHLVAVSKITSAVAYQGHLDVYDRSDPAQPWLLGSLDLPEAPTAVAAGDGWACVTFAGGDDYGNRWSSMDPSGVYLVSLADPTRPRIAWRRLLPGVATGVTADGDRVYVAMDPGGLAILDVVGFGWPPLYLPLGLIRER